MSAPDLLGGPKPARWPTVDAAGVRGRPHARQARPQPDKIR